METYTKWLHNFEHYLVKDNKKQATLRSYLTTIGQLHEFLTQQSIEPDHLAHRHMQQFLDSLKSDQTKARTLSAKTSALRLYKNFLEDQELLKPQNISAMKHPTIRGDSVHPLKAMEYRALRDACRDDVLIHAIVEVLLQTGIRVGELVRLEQSDIEIAPGPRYGSIQVHDEQGEIDRVVPLNNEVEADIIAYLAERPKTNSTRLFVQSDGNPIQKRWLRYKMDHYFAEAEIKNASVFDLRHTFCVFQLRKGINLLTVALWAGHRNLATMEKYKPFVVDYIDTSIKPAVL
jgi:integrase/recombinase XerC/integrase/recombinase XerD